MISRSRELARLDAVSQMLGYDSEILKDLFLGDSEPNCMLRLLSGVCHFVQENIDPVGAPTSDAF